MPSNTAASTVPTGHEKPTQRDAPNRTGAEDHGWGLERKGATFSCLASKSFVINIVRYTWECLKRFPLCNALSHDGI